MTDQDRASQAETPEAAGPPAAPAPESGPPPRARKRRGSACGLVFLVAGVALVAACAWFKDDLTGYARMRAWDRSAPTAIVARLSQAIGAGDVATVDAISPGTQVEMEGARIAKMKPGGSPGQMPPQDPKLYQAKLPLAGATYSYRFSRGILTITAETESGRQAEYILRCDKGKWELGAIRVLL